MLRRCFVLGALMLVLGLSSRSSGQGKAPPKVVAAPVVERESAGGQTFVATVKPVRKSTVGSAVAGRVEEFLVDEGVRVEKGQPLAKLRTGTLELERDAAMSEADARWSELLELVVGSRPEEIREAKAALGVAKARVEFTRLRRSRAEDLFRRERSIPEEELQAAVAANLEAEQQVRRAQATLDLALKGPREEKVEQAYARFLVQLDILGRLEDRLALHTIRAAYDAYVTREYTEVGAWLLEGGSVVDLVQLDEVDLEVPMPGSAVANLAVCDSARIEVSALADRTFVGKVVQIVPEADPRTRTFPVKVRVKNPIEKGVPVLKANMFAQATLAVGSKDKKRFVPKDAIVLGGPSPIVYVVDGASERVRSGKVKVVPVVLGVADGELIEVIGDVRPGQQVVVLGNERLRPGQSVTLLASKPK